MILPSSFYRERNEISERLNSSIKVTGELSRVWWLSNPGRIAPACTFSSCHSELQLSVWHTWEEGTSSPSDWPVANLWCIFMTANWQEVLAHSEWCRLKTFGPELYKKVELDVASQQPAFFHGLCFSSYLASLTDGLQNEINPFLSMLVLVSATESKLEQKLWGTASQGMMSFRHSHYIINASMPGVLASAFNLTL